MLNFLKPPILCVKYKYLGLTSQIYYSYRQKNFFVEYSEGKLIDSEIKILKCLNKLISKCNEKNKLYDLHLRVDLMVDYITKINKENRSIGHISVNNTIYDNAYIYGGFE